MGKNRLAVLLVMSILLTAYFLLDFDRFFSVDHFKAQQSSIEAYHNAYPLRSAVIYCLLYVVTTGLSLPGATVLTLAGGAVFGLFWGTILTSFASTIGATLAFLAARFVLRDAIRSRFPDQIAAIDAGMRQEGGFYLFTLRLVPVFPFFIINLAMGLTSISTGLFYLVSQWGMLAGTLVYVNAGVQIGQLENLGDILSSELLFSFTLLGIFPLIAKRIIDGVRHRVYQAK